MSIKYECHYCHNQFSTKERIDGFNQGYNEGFLCPKCGENIKDDLMLLTRQSECQKKWTNRALWFLPVIFISHFINDTINIFSYQVEFKYLVITASVIFSLLILLFVPCTRRAGVFITKPVKKS